MATIVSKSEAQSLAEAMRKLDDSTVNGINEMLVNGYANGMSTVTISQPRDMPALKWTSVKTMLEQKGYVVKSESCQRDGEWYVVTL